MELRVLRYFLVVAREESITRAAEVLHMTQPTLSRQLSGLEEELGAELLIRGKRRVSLTEAGMFLRQRAEEIVAIADKTEKDFIDHQNILSGVISLGSVESSTSQILAKLLTEFNSAFPQVSYNIFSGTGDDIKEKIDKSLLEIGVLLEPVNYDKYDFIRLPQKERWGILTKADSELAQNEWITQADLIGLPLINSNRSIVRNEITNWFGEDYSHLKVLATFNLNSGVASLVENGFGHAICIEGSSTMIDPAKLVFRPFYPELTSGCVLVWKKNTIFSPTVSKFIDFIKTAQWT